MKERDKTKKELMSELEELRLQLKHFERSDENGVYIPDETFRLIVESVPNGIRSGRVESRSPKAQNQWTLLSL